MAGKCLSLYACLEFGRKPTPEEFQLEFETARQEFEENISKYLKDESVIQKDRPMGIGFLQPMRVSSRGTPSGWQLKAADWMENFGERLSEHKDGKWKSIFFAYLSDAQPGHSIEGITRVVMKRYQKRRPGAPA